jgi:hypothetical protein
MFLGVLRRQYRLKTPKSTGPFLPKPELTSNVLAFRLLDENYPMLNR